jgi:hypothetical protein
LICTFPSRNYDIENFPAIKNHLLSFHYERLEQSGKSYVVNGETISARKKTNNKWYETQDSIGYWDDFYKQKIVWADLARTGNAFAIDTSQSIVLNTSYLLTSTVDNINELKYLSAILNSKLTLFFMNIISSKLDETGWRWFKQFVEQLPIPELDYDGQMPLIEKVNQIISIREKGLSSLETEEVLDQMVFDLYHLNEVERGFMRNQFTQIHVPVSII